MSAPTGLRSVLEKWFRRGKAAPPGPPPAPGSVYTYRASLIGAARHYELTDEGLSWRVGRRSGVWPYRDIARVQLSYRPTGMQNRRFRADIDRRGGGHIKILSISKQTAALMAPQAGYRGFVLELHRRLAAAGRDVQLCAGLRPGVYRAIVIAVVLFALAMAALLIRALMTGETAGVVFIVGFAALFAWQVGGFIARNRPHNYSFDDVPPELLP